MGEITIIIKVKDGKGCTHTNSNKATDRDNVIAVTALSKLCLHHSEKLGGDIIGEVERDGNE